MAGHTTQLSSYNKAVAGIGAVVIGISIPIRIAANKTATEAVEMYNGGILKNKPVGRYELKLQSTGNTVGLAFFL